MVGATSAVDDAVLRAVYAQLLDAGTPYILTDLATAELTKVAANAFLATKISFINAMANVCEAAGANVVTLADALGHDSRMRVAGSSPRVWASAAAASARTSGRSWPGPANWACQTRCISSPVMRSTPGAAGTPPTSHEPRRWYLTSRTVAVLGAAFKPETDDVRDSPALSVAAAISAQGATVRVHDQRPSTTHGGPIRS